MQAVTKVRIPWKSDWNSACAWAMEQYGLPGDKFTNYFGKDHIEFHFNDERDAIHFSLRWI